MTRGHCKNTVSNKPIGLVFVMAMTITFSCSNYHLHVNSTLFYFVFIIGQYYIKANYCVWLLWILDCIVAAHYFNMLIMVSTVLITSCSQHFIILATTNIMASWWIQITLLEAQVITSQINDSIFSKSLKGWSYSNTNFLTIKGLKDVHIIEIKNSNNIKHLWGL